VPPVLPLTREMPARCRTERKPRGYASCVTKLTEDFLPYHASALLNDLVGARQQQWRDFEAERLGRLEVDEKLEFRRLFNR
jgi:hypothetical protein